MDEILQDISKAVASIGHIDAVPTLPAVLRETTGMGFAAVMRVTEKTSNWESRLAKFTAHTDESHLILEVWNAGEPVAEDRMGEIFQPFWRHSASASRIGLGRGLYICSQRCHTIGRSSAPASYA